MAQRQILEGIRHGYSGYINKGCGCDICRAAFRESMQSYRQRRKEREANGMETVEQPDPDEMEDPIEPGTWVDDAEEPEYTEEEVPDDAYKGKSNVEDKQNSLSRVYQGPVLLGVRKDMENRNVIDSAPGIAAIAERLAQIIDNPLALPQAPSAAARLLDIYKEVGIEIKAKGSKLAAVKSMIARPEDKAS